MSLALGIGLPLDVSGEGWRIDHLLRFAHVAVGTLAAIALIWLGLILIRDRSSKPARYTHGTSAKERAVPLALAALVFFAVDGYMLVRSHSDLHNSILDSESALAEEGAVRLQIGARQWAWDIRNPGVDGHFGSADDIYSVSELVVPIGRAVVFELGAMDVVHALYLPNFRIKQDAIPGRVVRGWFRPTRLGRYPIACAQHCGVHHFQMGGWVRVLSLEDYATWQEDNSADALRMIGEDERAQEEEASRSLLDDTRWPEFAPSRDWAWDWRGEKAAEQ